MTEIPSKLAIAGVLAGLQRAGELTVWIDADIITIGPPVGRNMSASCAREHRKLITWQQAERIIRQKEYRERFTRRWN